MSVFRRYTDSMRNISENEWKRYVERLRKIDQAAADRMQKWIDAHGTEDTDGLIDYAFGTATKYGEAAAALACEMYDAAAAAQGAQVPPAEPAETATYDETAKAVRGTLRNLHSTVSAIVGRLVKQAGADTMLKNARRDGAEFAWIPWGTETCAFCITLASRGWQRVSKAALDGGHAEHIHANCFCEYAVRFDGKSNVAGYDPDRYLDMYYAAGGSDSDERIRNLRRELEAPRRDEINAQKRAAYARRREKVLSEVLDSNIIKASGTDGILSLASHNMHNSSDVLFDRVKHVPPIEGYDDVFIHGDAWGVSTKDADGNDIDIPNDEFIKILRSMTIENDAIRLCSCETGAADNGIASFVAREMNMPVMAPTTDVWIPFPDKNGISVMGLYPDNGNSKPDRSKPGRWRIFYPDGRIEEVET